MLAPIPAANWNFATAAHLLNRAGFGGPPAAIDRLVALGPERAIAQLVDFEQIPDPTPDPEWAKPDPERSERLAAARRAGEEERRQIQREEQRLQRQRITELRGWWLQRMATGPRPLQEKLVLFWHGHFATSVEKVRDAYLMWRQNELFRRLGDGQWLALLTEVAQDPAMLIWLDQAQSRRQNPNENFARELMELFTLGEGNYTEKDVAEAARALTGWSYDRGSQRFVERPNVHDTGTKTVLGRTGNLDGHDVLKQIVAQPQAARFITAKFWHFFAGEMPSAALNDALAARFQAGGQQFKPLLRAMFLSEEFYAPSVVRQQVKSPVQWLVGTARMLETELPPPFIAWGLTRNLGQDIFAPPNVKGWDGGLSWISTNHLLTRFNAAALLAEGDMAALRGLNIGQNPNAERQMNNRMRGPALPRPDVRKLFTDRERANPDALLAAMEKRLLQNELKETHRAAVREQLAAADKLNETTIRNAIRLVMSTPEYQLT